jgi:hypothetical protein
VICIRISITCITSKTDCDALLTLASKEKGDLDFKKISLEHNQQYYLGRSVQVATDLQIVRTELAALATVVAALSEGEVKEDNLDRKKKREYKLYLLEEKARSNGFAD